MNRTRSSDFTLLFEIDSEGEHSPPMRDVRRRLESWLAELDWSTARAAQEHLPDGDALPACSVSVGDWAFSFRAWPRRPQDRGAPLPAISAGPADGGVFDHGATILDRLINKADKYGEPTEPVIIAVRLDRLGANADDVSVALMGPTIDRVDPSDPASTTPTGRHGTGLFVTFPGAGATLTSPAC